MGMKQRFRAWVSSFFSFLLLRHKVLVLSEWIIIPNDLCRHVPTYCLCPSKAITQSWISARINMHFLNMGKWDILWILSLNCLCLFLPAICSNCATTIVCLGWIWCSGSDLYCCYFPQDLTCPLHYNQSIPAQSILKTCEVLEIFVVCQKEKALTLRETPERPAA